MHIAEGMLPLQYAAGYYAGAAVFVAGGIKQYRRRAAAEPQTRQLTGVLTAAVFLISLLPIPVPITGTSSHPGGTPLAAIILGPWIATLAGMAALLLQALFFAHGGLTTLGANTLTMGVFGGFTGWAIFRAAQRLRLNLLWSGMLAGFIGDLVIYVGTSIQLALAIHGAHPLGGVFGAIYLAFLPTQAPLAVLEGIFTGLVLNYVAQHRPDLLVVCRVLPPGDENVPQGGLPLEER